MSWRCEGTETIAKTKGADDTKYSMKNREARDPAIRGITFGLKASRLEKSALNQTKPGDTPQKSKLGEVRERKGS